MKIRNGFVSNSSSTAFILDATNSKVKSLMPQIGSMPKMRDHERSTGAAIGHEVIQHIENFYDWGYESDYLIWLKENIDNIGEENVVLVRESDEQMGGSFEDYGLSYDQIHRICVDYMEYH